MGASILSKLDKCPGCGQSVQDHSFSLLASIVIVRDDRRRLGEFFEALKGRRWSELLAFQEWEGARDNVELYGLQCESDQLALVVVRSPFELYDPDEIIGVEVLSQEESEALLALVTEKKWETIHSRITRS